MNRPIVVGVDGSDTSLTAARYAAAMAQRRHRPLRLVHGYLHPLGYGSLGWTPYAPALPDPLPGSDAMLATMVRTLRAEFPTVPIEPHQLAAGGAAAVIDAAEVAEAVVVGHRGLGGFAELLLGSVSSQVSAYAQGPVVVVRPVPAAAADGQILVGVDGSDGGTPALEFAFAEAADRGAPLLAVHVYRVPPFDEDPYADAAVRAERDAAALLETALAPWQAKYPAVRVQARLVHSLDPEQSLVTLSHRAALVVVGSRGRGGFKGLLLGSVSQALVHHGGCPVAVVHPHRHRG